MDFLDLTILSVVAINMILGYAFGLVRRTVAFLGLFAGVGGATLTSAHTSTQVAGTMGWQSALYSHAVTYIGMVLFTIVLFEVLGSVYQRHISALIAPFFDHLTGTLAGGLLGALEVAIVLIIGVGLVNAKLPPGYAPPPLIVNIQEQFLGSTLAPHLYALEPLTKAIFAWVLPHDIGGYFTQLLGP